MLCRRHFFTPSGVVEDTLSVYVECICRSPVRPGSAGLDVAPEFGAWTAAVDCAGSVVLADAAGVTWAISMSGMTMGGGEPPTPMQMAVATSRKSASKWLSYAAASSPVRFS